MNLLASGIIPRDATATDDFRSECQGSKSALTTVSGSELSYIDMSVMSELVMRDEDGASVNRPPSIGSPVAKVAVNHVETSP